MLFRSVLRVQATVAVAIAILLLAYGGLIQVGLDRLVFGHALAWLLFALLALGIVVLGWRSAANPRAQAFVLFAATALLIGPGAHIAIETWSLRAAPVSVTPLEIGMNHPDVVVIITDTMASLPVLEAQFQINAVETTQQLTAAGFFVIPELRTNYGWTYLSIPSLVSLDYPTSGADQIEALDKNRLYSAIGGHNRLALTLKAAGYEYIHFEGGWSGSRCGPEVDVCVRAPLVDDTLWNVIDSSVFRDIGLRKLGHAYSQASLHIMEVLPRVLRDARDDHRPNYILVHLMLPHIPLYIDSACQLHPDPVLGFVPELDVSEVAYGDRIRAYAGQVRCVNRFLTQIAQTWNATDPTLVLVTGDHGVHRGEPKLFGPQWKPNNALQVLTTTAVTRGPCLDLRTSSSLTNAGKGLLRCLGANIQDSEDRFFAVDPGGYPITVHELGRDQLPVGWDR